MSERLTWEKIKEKYPHQNVGLTDVVMEENSNIIQSAIVKYTDSDTDYNTMAQLAISGEIIVRYTTFDEDEIRKEHIYE